MNTVSGEVVYYNAAGTVLILKGYVLVLHRPHLREIRLPKGHIEQGESPREAAIRETREETGLQRLVILADLGEQVVEFNHKGRHYIRTEKYFLARPYNGKSRKKNSGEAQFIPEWMPVDLALDQLTFEAEREWLRRALLALNTPG